MISHRTARRVFIPACFLIIASVLPGQTPRVTLKGNYILAEEGFSMTGPVASMALLSFTETGSVSGRQLLRNTAGTQWLDLQGSYTFDGSNIGTLRLTTSAVDVEGNPQTRTMNYRFAVSATGIEAIRTDAGTVSSAHLLPDVNGFSGSFVFTEVRETESSSRVVAMSVDNTGNVTGTSIARSLSVVNVSNVSGNYSAAADGFGTLTLNSESTDNEGNTVLARETYASLSAKGRAVILRTAGGDVGLTFLSR